MEYRSNLASSAAAAPALAALRAPRRHYRQKVRTLAYVNVDQVNGGVIRDLSEAGLALQAVAPLHANQQVHLRFELFDPRVRVEAAGRVAWIDSRGQAGVEFIDLPQRSRRVLKEWLFTQLLATAHQASWDSIFIHHGSGEAATQLMFSANARPVIPLVPQPLGPQLVEEPEAGSDLLDIAWCPVPISPRGLARLVDSLVLLSAVLLFSVVAVAMTRVFPAWPVALAFALGIGGLFTALYRLLFVGWFGTTPGTYLAQLAARDSESGMKLEEEERFR